MSPLDGGALLPDISPSAPAGENLENDDAFASLERDARGKPERQNGDKIEPAEDPNWKDIEAQAAALMSRTYDLRVMVHLAVARLQKSGMAAFADTLGLIRAVLETRWAEVHPVLDPEDDNDPTLRANALLALAHPLRVLRVLRDMPLAVSMRAGRISWRDIGAAIGAIEPLPDREKTTETVIRAAFHDTDRAGLVALRASAAAAIANAVAISAVFDSQSGYGTGPDLAELLKLLREIDRYLERYTPAEQGEPEPEPEEETVGSMDAALPRGQQAVSLAALTSVSTRADALRLLDLVADYYQRYEPSSPLPFLLDRARRLADKNFLDILRDMAPEGLGQAQTVIGTREE